jgi:hypothetical protein
MSDEQTYENLKLIAVRVPDFSFEDDGRGGVKTVELPGILRIGTEIDGVFVPITEVKAGVLHSSAAVAGRAAAADRAQAEATLREQQARDEAAAAEPAPSGEQTGPTAQQ